MEDLKQILDFFGLEYHSCKFEDKELPKLVLVVNPQNTTVSDVKSAFQTLPAVAFKVSIISGTDYCKIAISDMPEEERSDSTGWQLFEELGCCGYFCEEKAVYIGFPYQGKLPIKRAIVHELGHYKQEIMYGATMNNCNPTILEYHNVMFNENKSNIPVNDRRWIGDKRIAYKDDIQLIMSNSEFQSFEIQESSYRFQKDEKYKEIKKSDVLTDLNSVSKKLLSEIEGNVNTNDNINKILFCNMLIELVCLN